MTATFKSSRHTFVVPCTCHELSEVDHINQGQGPYAHRLKKIENDIKGVQQRINEKLGMKCLINCVFSL